MERKLVWEWYYAIATNTLEKRTNYHFLRITELQEFRYVNMLVCIKKAKALLYKAEYIQALSFAFQDTFRETFVWTQIGGIFLIVLIFYKLKRLTFKGFFYNSNKKNF